MPSSRKTGLGTAAFFQPTGETAAPESQQRDPEPATQQPGAQEPRPTSPQGVAPPPPKKVRTTVMLYPETLAELEMLKVQARRRGTRATYSDILEEAIQALTRQRRVEV